MVEQWLVHACDRFSSPAINAYRKGNGVLQCYHRRFTRDVTSNIMFARRYITVKMATLKND